MTIAQARLTVTGAGPWQVVVADAAGELGRHTLAVVRDGERAYPAVEGGLTAPAVTAALTALRRGSITAAIASELGQHLFAGLCAPVWSALLSRLRAAPPDLLELALDLDGAPALRALPWELMRGPDGWLAQAVALGDRVLDVAITRRTARGVAAPPPLVQPLRYLFVIGTALDDGIRAGAECFGLLRQLGPELQERIVERVSLEALGRVVAEFAPHVVHVICHGRELEDGGVQLELWDEARRAPTFVAELDLVAALVGADAGGSKRAPAMVVLSACSSGDRVLASEDGGLARALVAAGVPLVVGTGAAVRDRACRLFTRGLGDAIAARTPLLAAAARGRRSALRAPEAGVDTYDWALVQTLLGHDVEPGLCARPAPADSEQALVLGWLKGSGLELDLPGAARRTYPPLCGGTDAIEAFYRLLAGPHAVLALVARPPREGARVGKRRLLSELAAIAIRAGHLPVLMMAARSKGPPRDPGELARDLGKAFKAAWTRHGLGKPTSAEVAALAELDADDPEAFADALADALAADCAALRARARAEHPLVARAAGQVVLMLHDVHAYGDAVPVVLALLRARGANLRQAAPVVLTWRWTPPGARDTSHKVHDEELRQTTIDARSTIEAVDLLPFAPIDPRREDLGLATIPLPAKLALQRVLLHPFWSEPAFATRRWLLDLRRDDPVQRDTLQALVGYTRGCCPGQFDDPDFLIGLRQALDRGALTAADDDDLLAAGGGRP